MVLVPDAEGPYLIGVHEVTNRHFKEFIFSEGGEEWTVERMTRAASKTFGRGKEEPPSPFQVLFDKSVVAC